MKEMIIDLIIGDFHICLLYTSDAADEEDSVDLGGRRIIKKKIEHDESVKIYNKCKSFYKPVKIPTRVVYFDEVRKNKKKQKVGVFEWKKFWES